MATPEVAIFYGLLEGRESQIGIGHLTILDQTLAAVVAMNLAVAFSDGLGLEFVLRVQVVILGGCRLPCPRLAIGCGRVLIALAIGRWKVRVCVGFGLDVTGGGALVDAGGLVQVADVSGVYATFAAWCEQPEQAKQIGQNGLQMLNANQGALVRQLELLDGLLG